MKISALFSSFFSPSSFVSTYIKKGSSGVFIADVVCLKIKMGQMFWIVSPILGSRYCFFK